MIFPKLKKQLKKTLIKAYIEYEESFFLLENSLKSQLNLQKAIFSTNLIGSNVSQLALSFSLKDFFLKLPTVLKVFSNKQEYDSRISNNFSLSVSSCVLVKKKNLLLKNKIHTANPANQKFLCVRLKLVAFYFFLQMKSSNMLLKEKIN